MKFFTALILTSALMLTSAGCGGAPTTTSSKPPTADKSPDKPSTEKVSEADIKAALDQLDPEDRQLAETQKYCAIEEENRLGAMGKPIKVMLKGEPVFVCCKGCKKSAERDPEETLLRAALVQLDPKDRLLAEAQKFCAVNDDERLGSMGKPFKVMLKDHPVFLCCKGCKKKAESEPDKTLAKVEELKARAAKSPPK